MTEDNYPSSTSKDLYLLLGLSKEATDDQIKRAYYRSALQYHPDRHSNKNEEQRNDLKEKFQEISTAYVILSDPKKRKLYDRTGSIEMNDDFGWSEYFDSLYQRVSNELLDQMKIEYKGSEDEKLDLIRLYKEHKGDWFKIIDSIFFGSDDEVGRYKNIIQSAISSEILQEFTPVKMNESKKKSRLKRAQKESKEAEELAKKLGLNNSNSLEMAIKSRARGKMDSVLSSLAAKYGCDGEKDPIAEQEFIEIQQNFRKKKFKKNK